MVERILLTVILRAATRVRREELRTRDINFVDFIAAEGEVRRYLRGEALVGLYFPRGRLGVHQS